ncbi:hypothetical protein ST47_g7743 [Ascochyta rabiei]|uniref:Uncharacterized protein n=1 Tax=Didymella rabiei TaxID=5454 RepID=A0A163ACL3_DIDRA|nr:hypothetical protein ST47_g7743 [Ascochyta rabiei]
MCPQKVPSVSGGILWPDSANKLFYLFGGEYNTANDVQSFTTLWLYDIIYNTWNRSSASDGSLINIKWPAFGAGTVTDTGTAYYYGGYLTKLSMLEWTDDRFMLNSLTCFNMNTRRWQNSTYDQTPRAEGLLNFIPTSDAGMLAYFGGLETNNGANMSAYAALVPNYLGGKAWTSCDVIRESQMLFVGGQIPNASLAECDVPKIGGQHGLLLGVPDKIISFVGGNADGPATATAPAAGFMVRDLSVYFGTTASAAPRTASKILPAAATATSTSQTKSKSNTGAIAGGVVGGVITLVAVIGIVFFCLRRRRRNKPIEPNRAELA